MTKLLTAVVFLTTLSSFSQISILGNTYNECLSRNRELHKLISVCSEGGNYQKAVELLKIAPDAILPKALLRYNLYGKENAFAFVDSATIDSYQNEFSKLYLSQLTKNFDDFEIQKMAFEAKYPNNPDLLRIQIHKLIFDLGMWVKQSEFDVWLEEINALLATENLSTQNRELFALYKLDLSNGRGADESATEKIQNEYAKIYLQNPSAYDAGKTVIHLDDCKSPDCKKAYDSAKSELDKLATKGLTLEQKTARTYREFSDADDEKPKQSPAQLEKKFNGYLALSTSKLQTEKLKAIMVLGTVDNGPSLGLFMPKLFKKISYSPAFKAKLPTKLTKPELSAEIRKELDKLFEAQGKDAKSIPGFEAEVNKMMKYSVDDLQIALGLLITVRDLTADMQKFLDDFSLSAPTAEYADIESIEKYKVFLEKNPLYAPKENSYTLIPEAKTPEMRFVIDEMITDVIKKYPGSVGFRKLRVFLWQDVSEKRTPETQEKVYVTGIEAAIDLINANQSAPKTLDQYAIDGLFSFADVQGKFEKSNAKVVFMALPEKKRSEILNALDGKVRAKPHQKNLAALQAWILKSLQ